MEEEEFNLTGFQLVWDSTGCLNEHELINPMVQVHDHKDSALDPILRTFTIGFHFCQFEVWDQPQHVNMKMDF